MLLMKQSVISQIYTINQMFCFIQAES